MEPTPKSLLLDLLSAAPGGSLTIRALVRAGALFGIGDNRIRVAVSRLRAANLVSVHGRGRYALGPAARSVHRHVATWRHLEEQVVAWDGRWLAVMTGGLARSDRSTARRWMRALELWGFRGWCEDLWIRPANHRGGLAHVRRSLGELGLPTDAPVFGLDEIAADQVQEVRGLWDGEGLNQRYVEGTRRLRESLARLGQAGPDDAARESFLTGGLAIRDLARDPLLPAPLVDEEARAAYGQEMLRYDHAGREIWSAFLGTDDTARSPVLRPGWARAGAPS